MKSKLQVGQKLWVVFDRSYLGQSGYREVAKVGREYAYLEPGGIRIRMSDMLVWQGDYGSGGRAFLSQQEHADAERMKQDYITLSSFIRDRFKPWPGLTHEMIKKACDALGVSLGENAKIAE